MKWRSVRTPMKNWTVSKSPKKGFTVHVLANRRSMGPRKKKTHWMANFLLEAKGYQNAASWKNGSAFRLDERRDDLVGQKPNVLCTNLTLHDFYSFSVGNPLNFLAKRKHANLHLTSSFGEKWYTKYIHTSNHQTHLCSRHQFDTHYLVVAIFSSKWTTLISIKEFNQTTSFANVDSGFNESRA